MTYVVVVLLILAVATLIAMPLLALEPVPVPPGSDVQRERLEHEKAAALLAIREAQLDQAMGKLSDDDYTSLRDFYERRALAAMAGLDRAVEDDPASIRCESCGVAIADRAAVCGNCGAPSPVADL